MSSSGRATLAVFLAVTMALPLVALLGVGGVGLTSGQSMDGKIRGGAPSLMSVERPALAFVGRAYSVYVNSTVPDNGTVEWFLATDASWLTIVSGGDGQNYCNLSGTPESPGVYYANLTVTDSDSYDYQNFTVDVREPGKWGYVETLSAVPTGTHDPANISLSSGMLRLIDADANEESLILQGSLYTFSRQDLPNMTVASYEPNPVDDGLGWNISMTLYPTRDESAFKAINKTVSKIGLTLYLYSGGSALAGVSFEVGESGSGHERVRLRDARGGNWTDFAADIVPAYPNRRGSQIDRPALSDSLYGLAPDRYTVSFSYSAGDDYVNVFLYHASEGYLARAEAGLFAPIVSPIQVMLVTDTDLEISSGYYQCGYWVLDDISYRGLMTRYAVLGPAYEYVYKGRQAWVTVKDLEGNHIDDASVEIEGIPASYNSEARRYEARLTLGVGWGQVVNYTVEVDGCRISDSMLLTVMPYLDDIKVSLPLWWNGWDWVTVFGRDDSTYATTGVDTYWQFSHPTTSYIITDRAFGQSEDILLTQSEIAIHYPHDYTLWPQKFWAEAVTSANQGHNAIENIFTFASRWDDPSYVGKGDMYISVASPGNSASWAQIFAHYARGTRILGFASNPYNGAPGNASIIGSWWARTYTAEGTSWAAPNSQWYPYSPMDLMDSARGPNTDVDLPQDEWNLTFWIAEHGGVRRVYNHGIVSSTAAVLLNWMCEPKTNFSLENWKATDGEVASYVYGRWTTDVQLDYAGSNATVLNYLVSRKDPTVDGYWRVPVTLAFNISGRILADIAIVEGNRTLSLTGGTLQNLDGKRVMDVGYDVRGGTAYVSYFWNASSAVSLTFSDMAPLPNSPPIASFVVDSYSGNVSKVFVFDASSSTDAQDQLGALEFRWDWNSDGVWDTGWSSNPIAYHQFSTPGNYTVILQVMDSGGLTGEAQANVQVTDIAIPEMSSVTFGVIGMLVVFVSVAYISRTKRRKRR